jgi:carboxymethylenebutenolidase
MQAAIDALSGPRFIAGFCWGGAATWVAACRCEGLTAASSFYGRMVLNFLGETPKVPVILHYGVEDAGIPLQGNVDQVQAKVETPSAVYLYPGAGHAFMAERAYHAPSAALAKKRTLEFFANPLKTPD